MLRARQLVKTFNAGTPIENRVLRGLNLDVPGGQFVTVIGSNGAGKSTLLNAICGDVMVDAGTIEIDGHDVTSVPTSRRAAMVARVFQDPMAGTAESLTIEENMALAWRRGEFRGGGRSIHRGLRETFRDRLASLKLGLENRLADRIGLLSGGQRQAISLLMASLKPSSILLLDEHTAALDPKTAAFVQDLTARIVEDARLTALMVTHSMRQALELGSRTIMLHEGQVILDVEGDRRRGMRVEDLLHMFEQSRGESLDDDKLLLA